MSIDKALDDVESVVCPQRGARLVLKVAALIVLVERIKRRIDECTK